MVLSTPDCIGTFVFGEAEHHSVTINEIICQKNQGYAMMNISTPKKIPYIVDRGLLMLTKLMLPRLSYQGYQG